MGMFFNSWKDDEENDYGNYSRGYDDGYDAGKKYKCNHCIMKDMKMLRKNSRNRLIVRIIKVLEQDSNSIWKRKSLSKRTL